MGASPKKNSKLTIGRLAAAGGVGIATVRYYQKRGLLAQPHRPPYGGFRLYADSDLERLLQIKGAQQLGFTLTEIGVLLELIDNKDCAAIKALITEKLGQLKMQIDGLKDAQKQLSELGAACRGTCIGECPFIHRIGGTKAS